MKLSTIKRWNQKQHKSHKRWNSHVRVVFKFKRNRNLKGKYVILLSENRKKYAAVLKFISRKLCKVKAAVIINNNIIKQISRKFMISPKKDRKLLRNIEVIVTKRFRNEFQRLRRSSLKKPPTKISAVKTITPIKILSCTTCNHKFTSKIKFEQHVQSHKSQRSPTSSEGELVIDDDVMFVSESENYDLRQHPNNILNLKEDPDEVRAEEFCCGMQDCRRKFDTEQLLLAHIDLCHKNDDKPFKCNKCGSAFKRESGLIGHQRMNHSVESNSMTAETPIKARRKSVFIQPQINGTDQKSNKNSVDLLSNKSGLIFKPFDSAEKTKFICKICSGNFWQRSFLDRHISVHHITKLYQCFKCKCEYAMFRLLEHLKIAHMDLVNDKDYIKTIQNVEKVAIFRCPFCHYSSKIRSDVNDHMKEGHYDDFEKSESHEEDNASSPDSLENLLLPESVDILKKNDQQIGSKKVRGAKSPVKKRRPINDPSFKYRCARCQRRFSKPRSLRKHLCFRLEQSEKSAVPVSRSTTASSQSELHNTKVTPTAKSQMINGFFNCLLCPQIFTDRALFNAHVSTGHLSSAQNQPKSFANGFYKSIN